MCGKKETTTHVLTCQDEDMVKVIHDSVASMDEWMLKVGTIPEVREDKKTSLALLERRPPSPTSLVGMTRI